MSQITKLSDKLIELSGNLSNDDFDEYDLACEEFSGLHAGNDKKFILACNTKMLEILARRY